MASLKLHQSRSSLTPSSTSNFLAEGHDLYLAEIMYRTLMFITDKQNFASSLTNATKNI